MEKRAVEDALLSCLRFDGDTGNVDPQALCALDEIAWERMHRLALRLGVAPLLYHRLRAAGVEGAPPAMMRALKEAYVGTATRNLLCARELRGLAAAFASAGIPLIVLKGAFLIEAVYRNPGLRPMGDMDLLAPAPQLERAAEVLAAQGYRAGRPLDTDVVVQVVHHLPIASRPGTAGAVEVHWGLMPPNRPYTVDVAEFWERALPAGLPGAELRTLCPEDLLLHLCMHLAYMHEFACGLRPFCDIAATVERYGDILDWDAVIERAERWHWRRGVYLALRLAREWLGAAIPARVLAALEPAGFDPALCAAAREQVFSEVGEAAADVPSVPFAALWERGSLGVRARVLRSRLFPERPVLSRRYCVRPDSPAIYGCYLRHWIYLLARYIPISGQLLRGDAALSQFVRSREALASWMADTA